MRLANLLLAGEAHAAGGDVLPQRRDGGDASLDKARRRLGAHPPYLAQLLERPQLQSCGGGGGIGQWWR
jgi:hypothetical protein